MIKASIFVAVGGVLATLGAIILLWNILAVFGLVQYAQYTLPAQLEVRGVAYFILIPAVLLIRHGLRGIRKARHRAQA